MPRKILDPTAPGTSNDFSVYGAVAGWEAVGKGTDDTSYISTESSGSSADFFCGDGWSPPQGRVMGVSVHCRMRVSSAASADVDINVFPDTDPPWLVENATVTSTSWTDYTFRLRGNPGTGDRFLQGELEDLGVGVEVTSLSVGGRVEVSKLWIAVEYVSEPTVYDPFDGAEPDAVVGPLQWQIAGTLSPTIVNDYLRIDDTSDSDYVIYARETDEPITYTNKYITELETRVTLTNPAADASVPLYTFFIYREEGRIFQLEFVKLSGVYYLGLIDPGGSHVTPDDYVALYQINLLDKDTHLLLRFDRDDDPATLGSVKVYLNYSESPVIDVPVNHLPEETSVTEQLIGFGDLPVLGKIRADVDYFSWNTFKKRSYTFRAWNELDTGENDIIASGDDADIVPLVEISPPGVMAGQSKHACVLDVKDPEEPCEIFQYDVLPKLTLYEIAVDYKMDTAGKEAELVLQRLPDFFYWNGSTWVSSYSAVTLPNSLTRTRVTAMTGISGLVENLQVKVTIKRKTASLGAYKILIYKVYLGEQ